MRRGERERERERGREREREGEGERERERCASVKSMCEDEQMKMRGREGVHV